VCVCAHKTDITVKADAPSSFSSLPLPPHKVFYLGGLGLRVSLTLQKQECENQLCVCQRTRTMAVGEER
jgi:hypothetical protein